MAATGPTKRAEWARAGDRVVIPGGSMIGTVLRVLRDRTIPVAVVQWPGSVGRHTITTLKRISA